MNDEIKEILDKLKDGNWYNELDLTGTMWIELKWEETHLLLDYITNLQHQISLMEEDIRESKEINGELQQENEMMRKLIDEEEIEAIDFILDELDQLTNNWNELRQHIKEYLEEWENSDDEWVKGKCDMARDILYDMEEIKEVNK